jgi:hypothetical protein
MMQPPVALANGPYRVVPGTRLVHAQDDQWIIDAPGTRRQRIFFPVPPVTLSGSELPPPLAQLKSTESEDLGGRLLPAGFGPERIVEAMIREQALVRSPQDVTASDEELHAAVKSGKRGVLVVAMGISNYGRLAAALAATIKATSPDVPVALAWSGDVLNGVGRVEGLFDHLVSIDAVLSDDTGRHLPFYVKLCAEKLTPFEQTIFIDADSLIYPGADLRKEFLRYESRDFVPTTSLVLNPDALPPDAQYMCWTSIRPIVDYFGLTNPILQAHSYYFFFANGERAKDVFRSAREAYRAMSSGMKLFEAGGVPDELALGIATSIAGVPPYFVPHQPMLESGLFGQGPPAVGIEACYLGFTVCGRTTLTRWSAHYLQTIAKHGLSDRGYTLDKGGARLPTGLWCE